MLFIFEVVSMKITGFESNNELLSIIGSRVKDFRIGMNLT